MSNLMISIENLFDNLFKEVANSFTGNYQTNIKEVEKITEDFFNEKIPNARDDRRNLKNDGTNVVKDYKKAYEIKKHSY